MSPKLPGKSWIDRGWGAAQEWVRSASMARDPVHNSIYGGQSAKTEYFARASYYRHMAENEEKSPPTDFWRS